MSFNSLGLSAELLKAISKQGYASPSPIQEKAIPQILNHKDVLASAQTGTGKTAGFTLPMLELLSKGPQVKKRKPIRALILTPTRELAAQVHDNVKAYSEYLPLTSAVIFGGVSDKPQKSALRAGVDILVATPGRLLDLHFQKELSLENIEILVLDEADRMLDMGFLRDIKNIINMMPKDRQSLLFSATFSSEIKKLANTFLKNPVLVEATPENSTAEKVDQKMFRVDKGQKPAFIIKMIKEGDWSQVLIFTRTKHGANKLSEKLSKSDVSSAAIHGNKSQAARTKALAGFKQGHIKVLVATDIAARGLDIPLLPHVINYELPNVPEDYVHRIGRTGRAGASGEAISVVGAEEAEYVAGIEKLLNIKFTLHEVEGFEPTDVAPLAAPKKKKFNGRNKSRNNTGNTGKHTSNQQNHKRKVKRKRVERDFSY